MKSSLRSLCGEGTNGECFDGGFDDYIDSIQRRLLVPLDGCHFPIVQNSAVPIR